MSCVFMNESAIWLLASAPSGASLLSFLPSRSRSKPSPKSAIASDEMSICRVPMKGTTVAPLHSGIGLKGSTLLLHPVTPTVKIRNTIERCMKTSMSLARAAGSIAVVLIVVNSAHAHPEFNPVSTNRYVKLNLLTGNEVRLAYTVMYGAAPAAAARKAADANADGKLDEVETRALGQSLLAQVQKGLALTVDGQPATPLFEPPAVGLAGAEVAPNPFSIDLIARVLVGDGPLNALHIEVDNRCFTLLALYQPMAADLRTIVAKNINAAGMKEREDVAKLNANLRRALNGLTESCAMRKT